MFILKLVQGRNQISHSLSRCSDPGKQFFYHYADFNLIQVSGVDIRLQDKLVLAYP